MPRKPRRRLQNDFRERRFPVDSRSRHSTRKSYGYKNGRKTVYCENCRKVTYETIEIAMVGLLEARQRHPSELYVYRCPYGTGFHQTRSRSSTDSFKGPIVDGVFHGGGLPVHSGLRDISACEMLPAPGFFVPTRETQVSEFDDELVNEHDDEPHSDACS